MTSRPRPTLLPFGLALFGLVLAPACSDDTPAADDEVGSSESESSTDTAGTTDTDTGGTDTGGPEEEYCLEALAGTPGADWEPDEEDPGAPVAVSFDLSLDAAHAELDPLADPQRIDPRPGAVTVMGGDGEFELRALARRSAERPDMVWLELYVLSTGELGVGEAELELTGLDGAQLWDVGRDPWADPVAEPVFLVGHVAPGAVGRAVVGVEAPVDAGLVEFGVELTGLSSTRRADHSAPLAVAPDGELWSPFADADTLAVVDTASDTRVDALEIPGRPSAADISHDGDWVLSVAPGCNQLVVIDRASREIVQVLGEDEGIGRDPRRLLISPDDRWAFVSSYVGDSVTVLRRGEGGYRVEATVELDRRPLGMAVDAGGTQLYVAHWMPRGPIIDNESWVSVVDLADLSLADEVIADDESNFDNIPCVQMIFGPFPPESLTFEGVFTQFPGVFVDPSGARALIPGLRVAPVPILEGDPFSAGILTTGTGANSPLNMIELDIRAPGAAQWAPLDLNFEITDRSPEFLECVNSSQQNEFVTPFPDEQDPNVWTYPGKTSPAAAGAVNTTGPTRFMTWTPDGRALFMLGTAADELVVLNGATAAGTHREHLTLSGENPVGLAFTPDGAKAYVLYENSTQLGVLDTSAYVDAPPEPEYVPMWFQDGMGGGGGGLLTARLQTADVSALPELPPVSELGTVALVDADPMDPVLRRGKILFNSSNPDKYPELSSTPQATCQACHPGGGTDGSGWSTVEGERRTLPLWGGTAGRGWLHYSASHHSSEEFATIIVEERLGGTGLSEDDVHALAEYVARGLPELQRPAVDEALAAEGQVLFEAHCAVCHGGEKFTSGGPTAGHPYGGADADSVPATFDVGTATDDAFMLLGQTFTMFLPPVTGELYEQMRGDRALGADDPVQQTLQFTPRPDRELGHFKAPSLINVRENPNFFHDARFGELGEVVDYFDAQLGLELTADERAALLEYLQTL